MLLFVNMTLDDKNADETRAMLTDVQRVLKKFNPGVPAAGQFAVYAQFTHDVEGGESRLNKNIATELIKRGLLTQKLEPCSIRFMEKVSVGPFSIDANSWLLQTDVNGMAMHDLYRVLKRQSVLFINRYGMAMHVKEHNSKFLTNKYGEVKHFYAPAVEMAVIEADIKQLILQDFDEARYNKLLNPPEEAFN